MNEVKRYRTVTSERYLNYKNGQVIDLLWKPYTLQNLLDNGMGEGKHKFREILNVLGDTRKSIRRIQHLYSGGWLVRENLPLGKRPKVRLFAYSFSKKSKNYLEKYYSFTNPDGYLMKRLEKRKEVIYATEEIPGEVIQTPQTSEDTYEVGEDTNLEYDNTRRESW